MEVPGENVALADRKSLWRDSHFESEEDTRTKPSGKRLQVKESII